MFYSFLEDTPAGRILVAGDDTAIAEVRFLHGRPERSVIPPEWQPDPKPLRAGLEQLQAYFEGRLTEFDVPIRLTGTPFQRSVWNALRRVPFGTTASYGQIAKSIGRPKACRAVGAANGKNHIPIIVPCHRIIGSSGALVGFGGGLKIKQALLKLEGVPVRA